MRGLVQAQILRVGALAESSAAQAEHFMAQPALTTLILRSHAASHGVSKDEGFPEREAVYSAANWLAGAAARTSASTCCSNLAKLSRNMPTSFFAVSAKSALDCQVFTG